MSTIERAKALLDQGHSPETVERLLEHEPSRFGSLIAGVVIGALCATVIAGTLWVLTGGGTYQPHGCVELGSVRLGGMCP